MEERHGWRSMRTLGRVLLILILGAAPAWAALGEPESSVSADGQVLRGQIRDEVHEGYRLHQITDAERRRGPRVRLAGGQGFWNFLAGTLCAQHAAIIGNLLHLSPTIRAGADGRHGGPLIHPEV